MLQDFLDNLEQFAAGKDTENSLRQQFESFCLIGSLSQDQRMLILDKVKAQAGLSDSFKLYIESSLNSDDVTRLNPPMTSSVDETLVDVDKTEVAKSPLNLDRTQLSKKAGSDETLVSSISTSINNSVQSATQFQSASSSNNTSEPCHSDKTQLTSLAITPASERVYEGAIIKGRFILEACIGHGGMGTVYKARDLRKEEMQDENPFVAIKFLNDEFRHHPDALIALQRETKKSQELAHPNIVTVYDFDRDGDLVFMTMEYLGGRTLDELIDQRYFSRLPVQKILEFIDRIARALAYSHQRGFVHADLKPGNIFLTRDGQVKVLDFGIAQAVRGARWQDVVSVFDAYSLGGITPNYASPEMLADERPTPADDIYALGCIAYTLLAGTHPFVDAAGNKITAQQAKTQQLAVTVIPSVPRRLMNAVRRCLAFERSQRFTNAGLFIDAIKPRVLRQRLVLGVGTVFVVIAVVSWYITFKQSSAGVELSDLPASMASLVDTIQLGDSRFDSGDIDQAHKLYAQAWESSFTLTNTRSRDQFRLKVIVERRMDAIADYLMAVAQEPNLDEFRLLQLQIALEFLQQDELGSRDQTIGEALIEIQQQLDRFRAKAIQ